MHDRARAATTRSEQGRRGRPEPPWTDHGHVATGEPKPTTDNANRRLSQPTSAIDIASSLRLSPEVDWLGLTRSDFRQTSR